MQSMHAQNMNRNNMPISPISPMPPTTNSPLSSLSSMSPLSSLSSLSSLVGQPNQPLSTGPKNSQGMNPGGMMNPHGPNLNANMQQFQSPHHQITSGMSPQVKFQKKCILLKKIFLALYKNVCVLYSGKYWIEYDDKN